MRCPVGPGVPRAVRRSRSPRGCGAGRPRGCARPSRGSRAAAAPQPRRRFQHHSHVDSRAPPHPSVGREFGGERGQVDGSMGFGTERHPLPPPVVRAPPKVGRGRRGAGGCSAGGCAVGADGAGLWDESCRASIPRIRAGILGDGGLGRGGATATGVSVLRVAGSEMWMGCVLDGAGY